MSLVCVLCREFGWCEVLGGKRKGWGLAVFFRIWSLLRGVVGSAWVGVARKLVQLSEGSEGSDRAGHGLGVMW